MTPSAPALAGRGIALVVALVVLAAMALAASALMRSVDTAQAIAGNLAHRDAAAAPVNAGVEQAWAALYENGSIAERAVSAPAVGYHASRLPGEDPRGVPALLLGDDLDPAGIARVDLGEGLVVRYVIERMCRADGPATPANCALVRSRSSAAPPSSDPEAPEPMVPVIRVSIRVDGARGTLVLAQAMIRDSAPPRRIAWRILAE
jgi:hypothetical protein